jgi:hypothetical protein
VGYTKTRDREVLCTRYFPISQADVIATACRTFAAAESLLAAKGIMRLCTEPEVVFNPARTKFRLQETIDLYERSGGSDGQVSTP